MTHNLQTAIAHLKRLSASFKGQYHPGRAISLGLEIDRHLPQGGLAVGAVHCIEGTGFDTATAALPAAFAANCLSRLPQAGAMVWAYSQDEPNPLFLRRAGIAPDRMIFVSCRKHNEVLGVMEEALSAEGVAAAVGEVQSLSLRESRRLALRAERSGSIAFVIHRPWRARGTDTQGISCTTRWRIAPMPGASDEPGLGLPRWQLDLLYCRNGKPASWKVEWNDEARSLRVVAGLAGNAGEARKRLRHAR
jgi:protein ImuA